jgi:hypothetical protein
MARKILALGGVIASLAFTAAPAFGDPAPPTNGGNGAGQSGQCTGAAADRPTSCKSP